MTESDWELFERLGDSLLNINPEQAFLCYENAEFYCAENACKRRIQKKKAELREKNEPIPKKVSIVIVSYNNCYLMQKCIESIRKYCAPSSYEIIAVDNASDDGVREWLQGQQDVKCIMCNQNAGFPLGCNIGIQYSDSENDIFLLNNDTRMTENALFWLRMGLYESDDIGAAGCVSNYAGNDQELEIEFAYPEEYVQYAKEVNVLSETPYEEKSRLCGFAMLLKRDVINETGGMDINFSPGYFDDDDLSVRIIERGYRMVLCHNSFIYHAGSQSFAKREDIEEIITNHYLLFREKWGFDITANAAPNNEAVLKITADRDAPIKVLEIGAGSGNTLSKIKYLYPLSEVYGIEEDAGAVRYAIKNIPILAGNWKETEIPFKEKYFDYIIYTDKGQNDDLNSLKEFFSLYLKPQGKFIF